MHVVSFQDGLECKGKLKGKFSVLLCGAHPSRKRSRSIDHDKQDFWVDGEGRAPYSLKKIQQLRSLIQVLGGT